MKNYPERITKINPFINKYKWEGINVSWEEDGSRNFEKNNVTIPLNVFHAKKEKMYPAYVSKNNSNQEKKVILLMIPNEDKCKAKSEGIVLRILWKYDDNSIILQ